MKGYIDNTILVVAIIVALLGLWKAFDIGLQVTRHVHIEWVE